MPASLPPHLANLHLIDHREINLFKNKLKIYINFLLKATYNGKIMQIDLPIKACQPDIHNLYKWGDYLYMPFLPAIHPIAPKSI